jgi:hypothetical protein
MIGKVRDIYVHDNKNSRKENERRDKSAVLEIKYAKIFGNKHSLQGGRKVVVYSASTQNRKKQN